MSENNVTKNDPITPDEEKWKEQEKGDHGEDVLRQAVLIDQLITSKLQEHRSLEILLRQQFSEHQDSFDRRLKVFGFVFAVLVAVLGFFGYSGVREFVRSQVGTQLEASLITPEVQKTVRNALETQTEAFVAEKIVPLNKSISGMRNDLSNLQTTAKLIEPLRKTVREISAETESIKAYYKNVRTEFFSFSETARMLIHPIDKKMTYVYFKLKNIPFEESVQVQVRIFLQPKDSYCVYKNIVLFGWGDSIESLKKKESRVSIKYSADPNRKDNVSGIELKADGVYADGTLLTDASFTNCDYDKQPE